MHDRVSWAIVGPMVALAMLSVFAHRLAERNRLYQMLEYGAAAAVVGVGLYAYFR